MERDRTREYESLNHWRQSEELPCQRERGLGRPSGHRGAWTLGIADTRKEGGDSGFPALHTGPRKRWRGRTKSQQIVSVSQSVWCRSVSWRGGQSSRYLGENNKTLSLDHHIHSDRCCGDSTQYVSNCDNIHSESVHDVIRNPWEVFPDLKTQTRHTKSKGTTKVSSPSKWFCSLYKSWLISNVILLSFFSQLTTYTAASHTKSSSSITRYRLLPPSSNTSIIIHFNPPSLRNLRVNTHEKVFFNFTIYQRNGKFQYHAQPNDSDDGSFSKGHGGNTNSKNNNNTNGVKPTTFLLKNDSGQARPGPTTPSTPYQFSQSLSVPTPTDNSNKTDVKLSNNGKRSYWVMVSSSDDHVARPILPTQGDLALADSDHKTRNIFMEVSPGTQHNFSVEGRHLGRASMSVAVVDLANDRGVAQPTYIQAMADSQYSVVTVRGERTAYTVFDSAVAAVAMIISFGMGAATEVDSLKRQLKYPVALIIAFCCQYIVMPVVAFGIAMALPLKRDIGFGLLCVACVPGGGLGHVAVIVADGDTALSMTVNFVGVIAMLGTAPLWIFVLGQYFKTESDAALDPRMIPIFSFEIWLLASFVAYLLGLITKRFKPAVADGILMWLIKPILLLASILYITLGVYINMYVFDLVNEFALLGAMLLPFCGCVLGGTMAAICRQGNSFIKTIALETCSLNSLVVMVALRFSLQQPDADLAAMIPIWVMFTIPGLFVFLAIVNKIRNTIMHYWKNRNSSNKDPELLGSSKAYSVSSSVVSPPGTTTLSAPLVVADGADDDLTISTTSNQKVTVL